MPRVDSNSSVVSILIPAYNSEVWISETIQSVLNQTWPEKEIILVDDGSTDNTFAIAQKFIKDGIKIFRQQNKGASAARNRAFQESTGNFIQYLDADDVLAPDKIEKQMLVLRNCDEKVISSSAWAMIKDTEINAEFKPTTLWADFNKPADWFSVAWLEGSWMPINAWLTPRSLIEGVGPWDETLSLHDDGESFCRVLLQSKAIKFCAEAKSYYRKGIQSSLSSQRNLKAIQSHFRICVLYEKNLLSIEDSARTRNACAANYQNFIYNYYPDYPDYLKKAALEIARLGGTSVKPSGSPAFRQLSSLIGWKLARRVERFIYQNKLNPVAIKAKLKRSNTPKNEIE